MSLPEINSRRKGIRDGMPIALGYFPVSFAFGIFATGMGLSVLEATLISLTNFTSAGQLAAVPIICALGSPIELILTQLIINSRYALMSISLSQRFGKTVRLRDRFLIAFLNTDEVFAVSMANGAPVGRKYMTSLIIPPIIGWAGGTLVGALAGNILPDVVISALGIAIYGMFIAIVGPYVKTGRVAALCVLSSIAVSCVFYYVPLFSAIPSGFVIIIASVLVSAIFALLAPIPDEDDEENGEEDISPKKEDITDNTEKADTNLPEDTAVKAESCSLTEKTEKSEVRS